jgi:hypothetical protein
MADRKQYYDLRFINTDINTHVDSSIYGTTNAFKSAIEIHHLVSNQRVMFPAFITTFSDDHQSEWNEESVYGRMDDLATFKRTKRIITLEFDVPSYSLGEAKVNLSEMSKLKQFLYPAYDKVGSYTTGNALAISSSPFLRIKFMNYIQSSFDQEKGLLGNIKNINFSPSDAENGVYIINDDQEKKIIPKLFKISLNFSVFHEHTLGWTKNDKNEYVFGNNKDDKKLNYPYNIKDQAVPPTVNASAPIASNTPQSAVQEAIRDDLLSA